MNILIVGGGGREHALAFAAAKSDLADKVYAAPGNPGIARDNNKLECAAIDITDHKALIDFALEHDIGLTIVGPEAPLVAGLVDDFKKAGLKIFGPNKEAARLEGSKAFTKDFLKRHNIPTAAYEVFDDPDKAVAYIKSRGAPIVVKADGLAAGKGVVVAATVAEAVDAVHAMLDDHVFGKAGSRVVIEDFMTGQEASFIVISDGTTALPMATSQDHKRLKDHDEGPNTGGMGAYSPAPVVTPEVFNKVMERIINPTLKGMAKDGNPYVGFLYAGLMIDDSGDPKVVEFNCRFGDPETQPIMMRLKSDLVALCLKACDGELKGLTCEYDDKPAIGVVLASEGYPANPKKGDIISGDTSGSGTDTKVFHAGTAYDAKGNLVTAGGRVFCVTATGATLKEARDKAYELCEKIDYRGKTLRHDIAWRALQD